MYERGYAAGEIEGWKLGYDEGHALGREEGAKLGRALGWMLARLLQAQRHLVQIDGYHDQAVLKRLDKAIDEIRSVPLANIEVDREAALARARALYKECCCHLPDLEALEGPKNSLDF